MQPPQSFSVRGQRSSGQLTGKPAGAQLDYKGRWCAAQLTASGAAKTNTRCPPKHVLSANRFFSHCRLTMQPPQSFSVRGQRSSGQLTGKPAGAQLDYKGRWCAVSRGYPGRSKPSHRVALGQLCATPWGLPSTVGSGIAWTQTGDV
ncbi:UNVERIFIED_CONTAM: hypothetical protein FKN15_007571 [Acipenser sinensis]